VGTATPDRRLQFSVDVSQQLVDSEFQVVVTGAGGWLGQATMEMLEGALGPRIGSLVHAFGSTPKTMLLRSGRRVTVHSLAHLSQLRLGPHLVVHLAFSTREHANEMNLKRYVESNREITNAVDSHLSKQMPAGLFMPSSGAVYLGGELATNPYGVLKLEEEQRLSQLSGEGFGGKSRCRTVISRLFNLSGPFLNKPEIYALGSILTDIGMGGPIRIRADHQVIRSYVHVADLIELAFALMLGDGPLPVQPFDTAGEREIEVGELAELAIDMVGGPPMMIERPPLEDSRIDRYVGDGTVMHQLALEYGIALTPLPQQVRDTAHYMGL
jgi:UDP-glucuronate decarboxylase